MSAPNNVTHLIRRWQDGDEQALSELTPVVYEELKRIAVAYMRKESTGHTLQATALVSEAFIKLAGSKVDYASRAHFLTTAARMMRRILVDHARHKHTEKRGGGALHMTLHEQFVADSDRSRELLLVDEALVKLEHQDPHVASVVELVFFGGLTYEEAAEQLNVSRSALYEDLKFAKAWIKREIQE